MQHLVLLIHPSKHSAYSLISSRKILQVQIYSIFNDFIN